MNRQKNVQSVYEYKWTVICQTKMIITYFVYYHVTWKQYRMCIMCISVYGMCINVYKIVNKGGIKWLSFRRRIKITNNVDAEE